jgi:hypothetical protein
VNLNFIVEAQGRFVKILKKKRLTVAAREWWFHNVP